jgi:hypothetical protein
VRYIAMSRSFYMLAAIRGSTAHALSLSDDDDKDSSKVAVPQLLSPIHLAVLSIPAARWIGLRVGKLVLLSNF